MSRKFFSSLVLAFGAMAFHASGAAWADPVTFTPFTVNLPNAIFPQLNGIDGNRVVGAYFDTGLGAIGGFYYDGTTFTALGQDRIANGISGTTIVGEYNGSGFSYDTGSQAFTSYLYPGSTSTALTAIDGTRVVGYWSDGQQGQGFMTQSRRTTLVSMALLSGRHICTRWRSMAITSEGGTRRTLLTVTAFCLKSPVIRTRMLKTPVGRM